MSQLGVSMVWLIVSDFSSPSHDIALSPLDNDTPQSPPPPAGAVLLIYITTSLSHALTIFQQHNTSSTSNILSVGGKLPLLGTLPAHLSALNKLPVSQQDPEYAEAEQTQDDNAQQASLIIKRPSFISSQQKL